MSLTIFEVNGIEMLSNSSDFAPMLGVHILAGLVSVVTAIVTMASEKRPGLHPICGTIYHWGLAVLVISAVFLAATDWTNDRVPLVIGAISLGASYLGRTARRRRWQACVGIHITSMGCSFIAMLTGFCFEEGKSLPGLGKLPRLSYWFLPAMVGGSLIIQAFLRYRRSRRGENGSLMRFMMVTKERVNEALPHPKSVVMFEYMESLHKAGVLLAQQRHSHRSAQQHAFHSCEARFVQSKVGSDAATSAKWG